MGIYIEGIEMPKEGHWKTIRIYPTGECAVPNWKGDCTLIKGAKAIEVPDHGRLIDADNIGLTNFEIILCQKGNPFKNALEMLLEKIESAPTIIPAEPGEEET